MTMREGRTNEGGGSCCCWHRASNWQRRRGSAPLTWSWPVPQDRLKTTHISWLDGALEHLRNSVNVVTGEDYIREVGQIKYFQIRILSEATAFWAMSLEQNMAGGGVFHMFSFSFSFKFRCDHPVIVPMDGNVGFPVIWDVKSMSNHVNLIIWAQKQKHRLIDNKKGNCMEGKNVETWLAPQLSRDDSIYLSFFYPIKGFYCIKDKFHFFFFYLGGWWLGTASPTKRTPASVCTCLWWMCFCWVLKRDVSLMEQEEGRRRQHHLSLHLALYRSSADRRRRACECMHVWESGGGAERETEERERALGRERDIDKRIERLIEMDEGIPRER